MSRNLVRARKRNRANPDLWSQFLAGTDRDWEIYRRISGMAREAGRGYQGCDRATVLSQMEGQKRLFWMAI